MRSISISPNELKEINRRTIKRRRAEEAQISGNDVASGLTEGTTATAIADALMIRGIPRASTREERSRISKFSRSEIQSVWAAAVKKVSEQE